MNNFENANLKFLMIPMIIVTICTSLVLCIETSRQYKKVTEIVNIKIQEVF